MNRVFVHGLGQTPDSWNKTISYLKGSDNNICPNLAEIVKGKEVNYENLYKAFSDICNELEEPIALCGLSLGGVLALNYAIDFPKKVSSLTLIAAQYKMPKNLLRFQNMLFRFMPKSAFLQMGFGKADFINLCRSMMVLDFSDSLQKVTCPALVVCGEKDSANRKAARKLADMLANGELEMIKGTGHEVNVEASEQLAVALKRIVMDK